MTRERDAQAFSFNSAAIALLFISLFVDLFPNALPSTTSSAYDLTLVASSSSHYTLTVMTVVAIVGVPIVLLYTGWTYWVFRHRLGRADFAGEGDPTPIAVIEQKLGGPPSADGSGKHAPPTPA